MARADAYEERRERGRRSRRNLRQREHQREPMPVRVLVYDLRTDETVREYVMNFNDPVKRKWLLRVQLWAFRDRKSVEILSMEDDELDRNSETGSGQDRLSR